MTEQQFCLKWNNFHISLLDEFLSLRNAEELVDVTLACEGKRLFAHKVVLSACSPYFRDLFKVSKICELVYRAEKLFHMSAILS